MTAQACARVWALCAALGLLAGCAGTPAAGGDAPGPLYKRSAGSSSGPQGNAVTDMGGGSSGVTVYGEIDVGVGRRR
ncbi:hypothetical protein EAG14_00840 [Acidovorax sp. 1608163]|mgnify:CR=1 FL=1|uniref:hypothetical protein n=1 Tax=Acidovorax sp. 1608163 TaxID=2478662 RepID=UPI000EF70477|nr:hypothetical protein [Acidovorax sp. 1608163]AYM94899.1 hypothetical protein EAG14_00840 [Acidovorax sp. 1608163]